jgi:hypothetical protein
MADMSDSIGSTVSAGMVYSTDMVGMIGVLWLSDKTVLVNLTDMVGLSGILWLSDTSVWVGMAGLTGTADMADFVGHC